MKFQELRPQKQTEVIAFIFDKVDIKPKLVRIDKENHYASEGNIEER